MSETSEISEATEASTDKDLGRFCVVGHGYWGAGGDLAEAKKNFRAAGGTLSRGYGVMTFPEGTEFYGINQYGRYEFKGDQPEITTVEPRRR